MLSELLVVNQVKDYSDKSN